jgi:uncharacterized protein YecT (DUF1311 family)
MSRARDIIQEIADIRRRRRFNSAIAELPLRLFALENSFEKLDKSDNELIRYFPVALVACIEGYFRVAIKDLIDVGEPFLGHAEKLASTVKIDFSLLRAVHGKNITVGELIAHGVSISRMEHIDNALSGLLGVGFLQKLRTTTDRWDHEIRGKPLTPILTNPDEVFACVVRMFELRHIICHEIASAYEIDGDEVSRCFEGCISFLRAADELISEAMYPGAPLSQADMNIAAGEKLAHAKEELEEEIKKAKSKLVAEQISLFDEAQAKWEAYCDAWSEFFAEERVSGGSMWPLIYASTANELVVRRIEELNNWKRLEE